MLTHLCQVVNVNAAAILHARPDCACDTCDDGCDSLTDALGRHTDIVNSQCAVLSRIKLKLQQKKNGLSSLGPCKPTRCAVFTIAPHGENLCDWIMHGAHACVCVFACASRQLSAAE